MSKETRPSTSPSVLSRMGELAGSTVGRVAAIASLTTAFAQHANAASTCTYTVGAPTPVPGLDDPSVMELWPSKGPDGIMFTEFDGSDYKLRYAPDSTSVPTDVALTGMPTNGPWAAQFLSDNSVFFLDGVNEGYLGEDTSGGDWSTGTAVDTGTGYIAPLGFDRQSGTYNYTDGDLASAYSGLDISDSTRTVALVGSTNNEFEPAFDSVNNRMFYTQDDASALGGYSIAVKDLTSGCTQTIAEGISPAYDPTTGTLYYSTYDGVNADIVASDMSIVAPSTDTDGDGLTDDEEAALGTDPSATDTDGDGTDDATEVANGTDPLVDETVVDTGSGDTGTDTGSADTGVVDTGSEDSGATDTASTDTGADTGTVDSGDTGGDTDTGPECVDGEGLYAAPTEVCLDGGSGVVISGTPEVDEEKDANLVSIGDAMEIDSTSDEDPSAVEVRVPVSESESTVASVSGHASIALATESNFAYDGENPLYLEVTATGMDETTGEPSSVQITDMEGNVVVVDSTMGTTKVVVAEPEEDTGKPDDTGDTGTVDSGETGDTDVTETGETGAVHSQTPTEDPVGCACATTTPSGLSTVAGFGALLAALSRRRKNA